MKVLQVIDSGGLYGAERVVLALMDELKTHDVDCSLASIAEPGLPEKALEAEARQRGLDVRRITMKAGVDRNASRELVAKAVSEGFDLFHTHGYKANTLIAGMPRRKRQLPAIATLHGWTAARRLSRMGMYEMAERLALQRADMVVAVSEAMAQKWRLRSRYGGHLRVIRNGIPVPDGEADFDPLPNYIRSFVAGRRSILAAGRLSQEKGFDVLLDALAEIRSKGLNACLVIAGEGGERQNLEAQARAINVAEAVLLPGYLCNAKRLMTNFDVLTIPSRSEGLPLVLLEALMAGIPVAATRVGEMPTVMQICGGGICVEPGSIGSLATGLSTLLEHVAPRGLRWSRGAMARDLFSAEAMASAYLPAYQSISDQP